LSIPDDEADELTKDLWNVPYGYSTRNATECEKCGGKMVPFFKWTEVRISYTSNIFRSLLGSASPLLPLQARWVTHGTWVPGEWIKRAVQNQNFWSRQIAGFTNFFGGFRPFATDSLVDLFHYAQVRRYASLARDELACLMGNTLVRYHLPSL